MDPVNARAELFIRALNGSKALERPSETRPVRKDTGFEIVAEVFTRGNCGNFAVAFNIAFPESVVWYAAKQDDKEDLVTHVICELNGRYYDITGDVTGGLWRPVERTVIEEVMHDDSTHRVYDNYSFKKRGPLV